MNLSGIRRIKIAGIISVFILVFLAVGYIVLFYTGKKIVFADPGLERVVRSAAGREKGALYRTDLERITHLNAAYCDIHDISGIELLPNLRTLDLSGNPVSSLKPLAHTRKLTELRLRDTGTRSLAETGIEELSSLPGLRILDCSNTSTLTDISVIAELSSLQELFLRHTSVRDIRPIGELAGLRVLDLRGTDLSRSNLTPLTGLVALEELNLRECGIQDMRFISKLTGLAYLNLHSNSSIESLEPLAELTRLQTLILRNVPVGEDIELISNMRRLKRLNIRNTGIRELDILAELMKHGALQDDPSGRHAAEVDIRENPIKASLNEGPFGYDVLLPYWNNIARRKPEQLPRSPTREVLINEVSTSSSEHPDWIELFNPGEKPVDISGFFLSDSNENIYHWKIPDETVLFPDEYMLIWASGNNTAGPGKDLHTNFRLSSQGTKIFLTDADRTTRIDTIELPAIPRDTSFGRNQDKKLVTFLDTTPGAPNSGARRYLPVHFSRQGGFYEEPFRLVLSSPAGTVDIYYTIDGSIPDPYKNPENTFRYTRPILIEEKGQKAERLADIPTTVPEAESWGWKPPAGENFTGTVIRAVTFDTGPRSNVYSESFFIAQNIRTQFPLAAISIIVQPDDFFSYENGIYIPGKVYDENRDFEGRWMRHPANYYEPREVPAHIEFFEPDGYRGFSINGGIRIHGSWSRSHPLKSLRLYARKDYERRNYFSYPVFPEAVRYNSHDAITEYKRLLLRSGQSLFRSHLQDAVSQEHVRPHVEVDLLRYRPVIHFINGEYWGIKNLRERFDRFYLEANYGVDPDAAVILEGLHGLQSRLVHGRQEDLVEFHKLCTDIEANDMNKEDLYYEIQERMDIGSFIDYNILRIYSGDHDGVNKHISVWRVRNGDGRWRCHTWDLDNALMFPESDTMTFYGNDQMQGEHARETSGASDIIDENYAEQVDVKDPLYTRVFVNLLQNREFRHRFINRFADLLNSIYRPEVYKAAIEEAAAIIEPEIQRHINRWGYPNSYHYWKSQVAAHSEFAVRRPEIQRQHIINYFRQRFEEFGGTVNVAVEQSAGEGTVRINSIKLDGVIPGTDLDQGWLGVYFSGVPIEIEALPEPGYRFAGWEGNVPTEFRTARKTSLLLEGDIRLKAAFTN